MKKYSESRINVSWKPEHMVNDGCTYGTKTLDASKTTSAYTRWWGMFLRCYNPLNSGYAHYGAKGVTVCLEWGNYQNFAEWYYEECLKLGIDPEYNTYQIDKDFNDSIEYGPETCKLIPVKDNVSKATSKKHMYISPDNQLVEIVNLNQFCAEKGLSRKQMYRLRDGTCKSHRGWRVVNESNHMEKY